jgi:hypothetical protein
MGTEGWVSLLVGAGVVGILAFSVWIALYTGRDERTFRPVWLVLLKGGRKGETDPTTRTTATTAAGTGRRLGYRRRAARTDTRPADAAEGRPGSLVRQWRPEG